MKVAQFHEMLVQRHSIRKYTDQPISAEAVKTIIEAALMAPSSKRCTPWEFLLVDNKEILEKLSHCREFGAGPIAKCSLAVFVMADPQKSSAWIEDCAIAATYIQLQAEALGIGSCWVRIRDRFDKDGDSAQDYISQFVNIPGEQQILCAITLGHPDEQRKPFDLEKLQWEKVHIAQ